MESKDKLNLALEVLLSKKVFTQESILETHSVICELYNLDRVCSYTRFGADLNFHAVQIAKKGEKPQLIPFNHAELHDQKYTTKETEAIKILRENHFVHTKNYSKYELLLQEITFEKECDIDEICVGSVFSREGLLIGYVTFEKFAGSVELTPQEIFEINILCEIVCDRIENYETRKKLHDEQQRSIVDTLTGLPSYNVFMFAIDKYMQEQGNYAIICFDVDKFKYVNEIWGYHIGDEILHEISKIAKNFVLDSDYCCRIAGDKFAMVYKYANVEDLEKKLEGLNLEFDLMQKNKFPKIKITIISGIYVTSENLDVSICIDRANIAKNSSKGAFYNICTWYNTNLKNVSERESQLENRASYALENNEFIPYLQPKFDMKTNKICGAEALARWNSADTIISPSEFIPIFERNGFITKLDFSIYKSVFEFLRHCIDSGYQMFPFSINVSKCHLKNANFCEEFIELAKEYNIPNDLLELEIKESLFMEDKVVLKEFIDKLRKYGFSVSIDDFGTAYSSLNLLKDIEVDAIKLDKSLIDNIVETEHREKSDKDEIIIKNIANMIHELNFKTIFEGIENLEQITALKEIGDYHGQGYVFSKPLDLKTFEDMYLKNNH